MEYTTDIGTEGQGWMTKVKVTIIGSAIMEQIIDKSMEGKGWMTKVNVIYILLHNSMFPFCY